MKDQELHKREGEGSPFMNWVLSKIAVAAKMRNVKNILMLPVVFVLLCHFAAAQGQSPSGFLKIEASEYLSLIPPYPVLQSMEDEADMAGVRQWQQSGETPRWQLAQADAQVSYERFAEAYGSAISPASTPILVHLLDKVEANLSGVMGRAKMFYNRPRPYQRMQMSKVCGFSTAPTAEAAPKSGNSYPSGHATFGWSVALLLAEVAPERAQTILTRGREYGESRIVCGVHFPSDVHAGEILVSDIMGRLHDLPEFRREVGCARQERAVALKTSEKLEGECMNMKQELEQKAAGVSK